MFAGFHLRLLRLVRVLLALVVIVSSSEATGTDRFFLDLSVSSENERYLLTAASPQNPVDGPRRAFAREFVYTLIDTQDEDVAWTRVQPADESSPMKAFVDDAGWVVVWTARNRLLVLEPDSGDVQCDIGILDQFTNQERADYVSDTSAGPMWSGGSLWSFLEHEDSVYFFIEPWWGHTIVVDLEEGLVVEKPGEALREGLQRAATEWSLTTLERIAKAYETHHDFDYRVYGDLQAALNTVARLRVEDAVPLLRQLEDVDWVGTSSGPSNWNNELGEGDISPFGVSTHSVRQVVHFTLRMLGERPRAYPCISLNRIGARADPVSVDLQVPREKNVSRVVPGLGAEEIVEAIGAPDFILHYMRTWEYDIDGDEPYILRLWWKDLTEIERVEIVHTTREKRVAHRRSCLFMSGCIPCVRGKRTGESCTD